MKKWFNRFAVGAVSLFGTGALAQESGGSGGVPSAVTDAISDLSADATSYANAITPYVRDVAVAFLAITAVVVVVGILRWGLRKAHPSAR